jgi:CheY-like chemotaxis protein
MFVQVDRSRSVGAEGLGIGLSISRRLVEMHGGTIECRSNGPEQGSEFIIRVPLADREARPAATERAETRTPRRTPPPQPVPNLAPRRVLIADDNVDAVRSLALVLRMAGYDVRTAFSGREAVEQAEWFRPEVALLDLSMPELDGFAVARRIRSEPWGAKMTLLALTGWGQPSHQTAAAEAGFDQHLVKPVDPALLLELLASLVPGAAAQEAG